MSAGRDERGPPAGDDAPVLDDAERERRSRRVVRALQAGAIVFLAMVALGLIPEAVARLSPAQGEKAALLVWFVAPAIPLALIVVAALRLRR
jgi:hypothetical protein